jgi:hypothetical protein
LWEEKGHEPAVHPDLTLAVVPDSTNVLVQYNEGRESQRRSYWLFEYGTGFNGKPRFVSPKEYKNMTLIPIPLSDECFEGDAEPAVGYAAVSLVGQRSFELRRDGVLVGSFYLPDYHAYPIPTYGRVLLTPVAAVGDAAIVAGAILVIAYH